MTAKIVHKDKAHEMRCCTKDGPCNGQHCMAWQWAIDMKKTVERHGTGVFQPIPVYQSENGYCGMVKP